MSEESTEEGQGTYLDIATCSFRAWGENATVRFSSKILKSVNISCTYSMLNFYAES